jgi:hypothetical protein
MVVIGTDTCTGTIKVTMRYDLPDPADEELAADIAEHASGVFAVQRLTAALAVGYGTDELVRPLAAALSDAMAHAGIYLAECLRADDDRYWSYIYRDQESFPPEGTRIGAMGTAEAAALAAAGEQVLPSRDAVAATIAPVTGDAVHAMQEATQRAEQHVAHVLDRLGQPGRTCDARRVITADGLDAVAGLIATYRDGGQYSSDYQIAWLTVALKDLRIRDDAWARMEPRDRAAHLRMWTDVVRRAQPRYVAAPASLLAFVAWQSGHGALANLALDRALADRPGYSMAELLRQVITAGAPPSMARLPLTPDEVAAAYSSIDEELDAEAESDEPDGDDSLTTSRLRTSTCV